MRNRVYVTSLQNADDIGGLNNDTVNQWTNDNRNILTFVPTLDGLFLNGQKYHSISDIQNDESINSVFRLVILRESSQNTENNINNNNTNYISLQQEHLRKKFQINTIAVDVSYTQSGKNIYFDMTVGERVQILLDYNAGYTWVPSNPSYAIIDRNYIIHALKPTSSNAYASMKLMIDNITLFTIYIRIWGAGRNLAMEQSNIDTFNGADGIGGEDEADTATRNYKYDDIINDHLVDVSVGDTIKISTNPVPIDVGGGGYNTHD